MSHFSIIFDLSLIIDFSTDYGEVAVSNKLSSTESGDHNVHVQNGRDEKKVIEHLHSYFLQERQPFITDYIMLFLTFSMVMYMLRKYQFLRLNLHSICRLKFV